MSRAPVKRSRQWQTERTRQCILDAAREILREGGEEAITMAAVAARVNITERTVYRHFESRSALRRIVWERRFAAPSYPQTADELIDSPRLRFRRWDKIPQLTRSSVYSRAWLDARKFAAEPRQAMLAGVRAAMPLMDYAAAQRRAAIVELISSPYSWEILGQLWELDGIEAGEAASEALEVLLGIRAADL